MKSETLTELWRYRELLYFFAWRDIKVRYRQAAFGIAWALIQPLLNMIIFTLLFGRVATSRPATSPIRFLSIAGCSRGHIFRVSLGLPA